MKCKKIFINILESKDTIQEINDKITNDLQGYHIVLENKTFDCFICDFEQISENDVFWSIDMKKTIKKCTCFMYNSYKCSIEIKKKEKIDLIIWIEENKEFELKSIKNNIIHNNVMENIVELDSILIKSEVSTTDISFFQLFGFHKKYHFDQYRLLIILNMCNINNIENEEFINELIDKIIKNSKNERKIEDDKNEFYKIVLNNLLNENAGIYDLYKNYRSKILNRLSIDSQKKYPKKIAQMNNPFQKNEILKTITYKTIQNELFIMTELNRKETFLSPQNSIMIIKYKNWNIAEIEKTMEKIILASSGENYEIILFIDFPNYLHQLEKIIENLFYNYDLLFKVKIILYGGKMGKLNLSEMQKLLIMSNFVNSINPYFFIVNINSWFPPKYIDFIKKQYNESDKIILLKSSNVINLNTGHIQYYEANNNKLYNYFIECIFPVIDKKLFDKINYKVQLFGNMNKFKELKNFLMKNGTINELKILDNFNKNTLHVFDS